MAMSRDNFPRRYSIVADVRRQWSDAEKQKIVAEAERPDANVSAVARRHGITPGLLFRWRRMAREAQAHMSASMFVPVTLALPLAAEPLPAACPDSRAIRPRFRWRRWSHTATAARRF